MIDARAALAHPNVAAFLHVIRLREAGDRDTDYTIINGGSHFTAPPWVHPYHGVTTTNGGKASGAYQFLGTTWARLQQQRPDLLPDFSPECQDLGAVLLIAGRGALEALMAGQFDEAVRKCRPEWTSLPGASESNPDWTLAKAADYYASKGGHFDTQPAAPIVEAHPQSTTKSLAAPTGAPMPILAVLGPILAGLIPQLTSIFAPKGKVAQRNTALAQVAVDTIIKAAGAVNLQEATEKLQADPELVKTVTQAVVTQPDIMVALTLPADADKAAERGIVMQNADKPFWFNPVWWISVLLFPMMYMITWQVLFTFAGPVLTGTGVEGEALVATPWYAQIGFDPNTRTGLINLIVGFIFGGVCGIWFGTSVSRQRMEQAAQAAAK